MAKSSLGRKGLTSAYTFCLQCSIDEVRIDTQAEQDLEGGTEGEAMEECCLLAWSVYFLKKPRTI